MVILGLLKHNDSDQSYFNTITRFTNWCQASNLILNTDKTKEMVFDFSRTYDVTSNVFIDNKPIDKVLEFKHLGTIFSHDLKWQANSDALYKRLKSRFYAFSKFRSFKPSVKQCHHFIQSLILPILLYNSELWYHSCTQDERDLLLSLFSKAKFHCDIPAIIEQRIFDTAVNFYRDPNHILNHHYFSKRNIFICCRTKTARTFNSFIPLSIRILNKRAFKPVSFTPPLVV